MKLRPTFILLLSALCCGALKAQEEASVFSFLRLPLSSHAAALGGQSTALADNDAALISFNPALMQNVKSKTLALGFLSYMQGVKTGNANYVQAAGEYGTWGVSAQFASYGSIDGRDESGISTGSFAPLDLAVGGGYSHVLTDYWSAGAMGRLIYSHYDIYSSLALGVDLGINYLDEEQDVSLSLTANNIGVQVKRFADTREHLPFNLQLGFVKGLGHAPIRVAVTLTDLTRWDKKYYYHTEGDIGTGKLIFNHLVVGADIVPANFLTFSVGYNFRRSNELLAAGSSKMAGLALGADLHLKRFRVGVSWAKYHISASSLGISAQYSL